MTVGARARALTEAASLLEADAGLLRNLPPTAIGVTEHQWRSLLSEASLAEVIDRLGEALAALTDQSGAESARIGRELRPAAMTFACEARKVARMLWQLAAFAPDNPYRAAPALVRLIVEVAATLGQAAAWLRSGLASTRPELPTLERSTAWEMPGVADPIAASFDVDTPDLIDRGGQVSDARLLAEYRKRLPELEGICHRLLSSISQPPLDPFAICEPLLEMLRVERPLLAWTVGNQALALIRESDAADRSRVVEVFAQLRRRAASRTASRERLSVARRAAETSGTEADRALAELSAYRIMVEGQLRPWGWALLRLTGAEGELPMLAELRDRLAAHGQPLHAYLANALIPALRNADAHEEAYFDQIGGHVVVGDQRIDHETLRWSNAELAAVDAGVELALACARTQVASVAHAYMLRPGDPLTAAESLPQAEQRYGHAGLRVWALRRDRSTVQVELDEIDPLRFSNPCLLATVQANCLVAGVDRWQIGLRGQEGWVIDLPAVVLRENWPILERAIDWFSQIPQETFLPCVTWARLAVEPPGVALRAAAWLALNDLQHAIEDAKAQETLDIPEFDRRVRNVIGACAATLRVMPRADAKPLEQALDLARRINSALGGMPTSRPLSALIYDVLRERDRLPVPAVMPTLDPRPLDVAGNES